MAGVYCLHCIWMVEKGGLHFCGNPVCSLYNGTITIDKENWCSHYKGRQYIKHTKCKNLYKTNTAELRYNSAVFVELFADQYDLVIADSILKSYFINNPNEQTNLLVFLLFT